MNPRIALCLVAVFLCSMGLPFAEYGTEEEERLKEITTHRHSPSVNDSGHNITGFQEGSVYSHQPVIFASDRGVCQIIEREVWCEGLGYSAYRNGEMFGNRSLVENWPDNPEFLGSIPDYTLLDEPYRIDMIPENKGAISLHRAKAGASTCAILEDGSMVCWGEGIEWIEKAQQEGVSTYTLPALSLPDSQKILTMDSAMKWSYDFPDPDGPARRYAEEFACVLTDRAYNNTYCFPLWNAYGNFSDTNQHGELGLGYLNTSGTITSTLHNHTFSALDIDGERAVSISVGSRHACAITQSVVQRITDVSYDGLEFSTVCWGDNTAGQLGNGSRSPHGGHGDTSLNPDYFSPDPLPVDLGHGGRTTPMALSLSDVMSCALQLNGDVSCWGGQYSLWGEDEDGNLVLTDTAYSITLSNSMPGQAISLYTSPTQVCVLSSAGMANCWQRETDWKGYGILNSTHPRLIDLSINGSKAVSLQASNSAIDNRFREICTLMENGTHTCYHSNSTEADIYTGEHDVWNGTTINHRLIENQSVLFEEQDGDGDGIPTFRDLCPTLAGPILGCGDYDGDGIPDIIDRVPGGDTDGDGIPNHLDPDDDNDGVMDIDDSCPKGYHGFGDGTFLILANRTDGNDLSHDWDGDGCWDLDPYDLDDDNDGVMDVADSCPKGNLNGVDHDGDGCFNAEDHDDDGDGYNDTVEVDCNSEPLNRSSIPSDHDDDGECDAKDSDMDNDGIANGLDDCPDGETNWANESKDQWTGVTIYHDRDSDGCYDVFEDDDDDNDGYPDVIDAFEFDPTEWLDTDEDRIGNNADIDDDGDGYNDALEIEEGSDPLDPDSIPVDTDGDLVPDSTDPDRDGDGYNNTDDAFPLNGTEWFDSDSDSIGDNADSDDDDDGVADSEDGCPVQAGTSSEDRLGCPDADGDGFSDEYDEDPNDAEVTVTPGLVRTALNQEGRIQRTHYQRGYVMCGGGSHFAIAHKPLESEVVGVGMTAIIHNGQQKIQRYDENGWTSSPTFPQSISWDQECTSGGGQPELAIDSEGSIHVLYWSTNSPKGLYYARWDGNEILTTAIEESNHRHAGTGVGMAVHDGTIHIVWNSAFNTNVRYASSTNGVDWEKENVTYSFDGNYFGGADVAIGMDGGVHVTYSWYSIFDFGMWGVDYEGIDGVYHVKKRADETFIAHCTALESGGCQVYESHVNQKTMAMLVGEPSRGDPNEIGCGYRVAVKRTLCNYNHVVRAPKIVASTKSPAVHIAAAGCEILYVINNQPNCVTANSMWVFSSFDSGDSWSKSTLDKSVGGVSYDIAMDPSGDIFSTTPHIVYSSGYSSNGGNSKSVTHAVMTEWGKWEQRTVPGASVSGVGLALDRDQYPLIIHGDGNNGQWGEGDVQIYITGWDLDGDELPSWKDQCPWIYGLSTDEKLGCQDLDGDGESELNDVSEQADDDTPAIGVLGATIIMVAAATILQPKRREDDGNLVDHGIDFDN